MNCWSSIAFCFSHVKANGNSVSRSVCDFCDTMDILCSRCKHVEPGSEQQQTVLSVWLASYWCDLAAFFLLTCQFWVSQTGSFPCQWREIRHHESLLGSCWDRSARCMQMIHTKRIVQTYVRPSQPTPTTPTHTIIHTFNQQADTNSSTHL